MHVVSISFCNLGFVGCHVFDIRSGHIHFHGQYSLYFFPFVCSRACVRTRGLISINFITPWSCLQFVLRIVAPEQTLFRGNFVSYLQRSCSSDYIRHIHYAFIIIFETIHTGCCYGHKPHLARSPLHGASFGWFVFLSSHPIPAHSFSGLYPSSGRGRQISPSLRHRSAGKIDVNRILSTSLYMEEGT